MERKIQSCIKERGLVDSSNVIMEPPFFKEIMTYPNSRKLKPLSIDPYDRTKGPVDYM